MRNEWWGAITGLGIAALGGLAGWLKLTSDKRKTEAEAKLAEANADSTIVASATAFGREAYSFGKDMADRLRVVETEMKEMKAKYVGAIEDVHEAIRERHKCEDELATVRMRLDAVEHRQRELREHHIDGLVWPTGDPNG